MSNPIETHIVTYLLSLGRTPSEIAHSLGQHGSAGFVPAPTQDRFEFCPVDDDLGRMFPDLHFVVGYRGLTAYYKHSGLVEAAYIYYANHYPLLEPLSQFLCLFDNWEYPNLALNLEDHWNSYRLWERYMDQLL